MKKNGIFFFLFLSAMFFFLINTSKVLAHGTCGEGFCGFAGDQTCAPTQTCTDWRDDWAACISDGHCAGSAPTPTPAVQCFETDSSNLTTVFGTCTDFSVSLSDTCRDSSSVEQFQCSNNRCVSAGTTFCFGGTVCVSGQCVLSPLTPTPSFSCSETDPSNNILVSGTCNGINGSFSDFCPDSTSVEQFQCSGNNCVPVGENFCPAGTRCTNDRCVPLPTPTPIPLLSLSRSSINFGPITVNTSTTQTFTVSNSGGGTLSGTVSLSTGSPIFSMSTGSFNLTAGQSSTFIVRFSPAAETSYTGTVRVSAGAFTADISLNGTGTSGIICFDSDPDNFNTILGNCNDIDGPHPDACNQFGNLNQFECSNNRCVSAVLEACGIGLTCSGGACVSVPITSVPTPTLGQATPTLVPPTPTPVCLGFGVSCLTAPLNCCSSLTCDPIAVSGPFTCNIPLRIPTGIFVPTPSPTTPPPSPTPTPVIIPPLPPCAQWGVWNGSEYVGVADISQYLNPNGSFNPANNINCIKVITGIGDINPGPKTLVARIFGLVLGLSGGIALILIILSGYRFMTSGGNPESFQSAKDMLASAIVGILFVIFAFVILQIIGVDILHIPGFG